MKKILLLIFLSMFLQSLFAQSDFAEIKGTVDWKDWRDTGLVKDAEIIIKISDSIMVKVFTNEEGTYSIRLKKFKGPIKISVETTKKTVSTKKKPCGFISTRDLRLINDFSKSDIYIADFSLHPFTDCYSPAPTIYFKFNSIEPFSDKENTLSFEMNADTALHNLVSMLNENPEVVMQLSGHCDSEEIKIDNLSSKRAQFVKDKLVSLGINPDRLEIKGYGRTQMIISENVIVKSKIKAEREALRQRNRRVTFKILSFDFKK